MTKKMFFGLGAVLVVALCVGLCVVVHAETTNHEYAPLEWTYGGNAVPETYYTPYLPLVEQHLIRFRVGFRFSTGTIAVKCPVKLTFSYDPANAKAGKDLAIKIKAETKGSNSFKTFESAFGLHLPNEIQIGFLGITGVPDFLPWYTLPWDICQILGKVPGLPQSVKDKIGLACSAIDNVGVNMETNDALPLPGKETYDDERTLMEVDLSEAIPDSKKQDLAIAIYNGISNQLGSYGMGELLLMVRLAKSLADEDAARDFVTGLCGSAVDALTGFAKISVAGKPYFSVEGVELRMNVRMYIPGGKGSGTYPVVFTANGQEQTVTFKDITPFIEANDKLTLVVDSMEYRFKLFQGLDPIIGISLIPITVPSTEKYVTLTSAKRNFSESDYKLEIPLAASTDAIQSMRTNSGCESVSVNWASPAIPLKGTVKVYDGNTYLKSVTESTFKIAHNVIVPGLTKNKTYRFDVECVNEGGKVFPGGSVTATTLNACQERVQLATCNSLTISNVQAQAGQNYIDFTWDTNQLSSTEILISPSPDLSANYYAAIKKQGNVVVQGWGTRGGERELETNHSIRVSDLDPGTKYYYNVVSWSFEENNPTKNPINRVGTVADVTTLPPPPPITTRVRAIQSSVLKKDVPIQVWKQGGTAPVMTVTTGSSGSDVGITPPIPLDIGVPYVMKIRDQECYKDADTSPVTATGDPYQQDLEYTDIEAAYKPPAGAYVFDKSGNPMSGVSATMNLPNNQTMTATTDASGYYVFRPYIPPASATVTLTKQDFVSKTVQAKVEPCAATRKMSIENAVLESVYATLNIKVIDAKNVAINNATVVIKEGAAQVASLTTNAQGKATLTKNFNDNNANYHNLTITVTPPAATGINPNTKTVSIIGGSSQDAEIMCLKPPPPAEIPPFTTANLNLRAESVTANSAVLKWNKFNNPATFAKYTIIKASSPSGTTGTLVSTITDLNTVEYPITGLGGNAAYRYVLSIYNKNNAIVLGPVPVDFKTVATAAPAVSKFVVTPETVTAGQSVTATATLSDADSNLEKAALKILKASTKTERLLTSKTFAAKSATFSHAFTPLASEIGECIVVLEVSDASATTTREAKLFVNPAAKEEKETTTQETGAEGLLAEQKEKMLEEQKLKEEELAKEQETTTQQGATTTGTTSGTTTTGATTTTTTTTQGTTVTAEKTLLKFITKPTTGKVNKELSFKFGVRTLKSKLVPSTFSIDWGDGTKEEKASDVTVKHTYKEAKKFKVSATATVKDAKLYLNPDPASYEINITVAPPSLTLSKGTVPVGTAGTKLMIKATEGSYVIKGWVLSFGDGQSETGTGKITLTKTIMHTYAKPGTYKAELAVTDESGTVTKKTLNVVIAAPAQ